MGFFTIFTKNVGKSAKQGNLQKFVTWLVMNRFGSGLKYWNQCIEPQPIKGCQMTLKVKVKVTQGQISTLYAKCSGLHAESCSSMGMTFGATVKASRGSYRHTVRKLQCRSQQTARESVEK
jgi:hypothetical protein